PGAAAVTSTWTWHPAGGICAPEASETLLPPAVAVTVPAHVVPAFGVAATTRPAGNVSTRSAVSVAVPAGWARPIVNVLDAPAGPLAGEKDFVTEGGAAPQVIESIHQPGVPLAAVELSSPVRKRNCVGCP